MKNDIANRVIVELPKILAGIRWQVKLPGTDRAGVFKWQIAFVPEVRLEETAVVLS